MALAVDAGGRVSANPQTGKINRRNDRPLAQSISDVVSQATNTLGQFTSPNVFMPQTQQAVNPPNQLTIPTSAPSGLSSSFGTPTEMVMPRSLNDAKTPKSMFGVDPTFKSDEQITKEYEDALIEEGAPQSLFARIKRKNEPWWSMHAEKPTTKKGMSMLGSSSSNSDMYVDMSMAGDTYANDDGKTCDYIHLTAPRATGSAM